MKKNSVPRKLDEVFPDDEVEVTFRLGPGHQSPRSTSITAAKFQVAAMVAGNGAAVVYGD